MPFRGLRLTTNDPENREFIPGDLSLISKIEDAEVRQQRLNGLKLMHGKTDFKRKNLPYSLRDKVNTLKQEFGEEDYRLAITLTSSIQQAEALLMSM